MLSCWATNIFWQAAGDMIALDAVYHRACLTKLYRKSETVGCYDTESNGTQVIRAYVLNELFDTIEEYRDSGKSLPMADMITLYNKQVAALVFFYSLQYHTST